MTSFLKVTDPLVLLITETVGNIVVTALAVINTITITVEHTAPTLQRGEPYAKQNSDFTGSCPGCHLCLDDL